MYPETVKCASGSTVASYAVHASGIFQIQMSPESVRYATGNIVAGYAALGSGPQVMEKTPIEALSTIS